MQVATGSATDMLKLIPQLVDEKDFVVLKFDVDPNRLGCTMLVRREAKYV